MRRLPCPYLDGPVELTPEREQHIAMRHPDLLPEHGAKLAETLRDPDDIRRSARFGNAKLFSRWYDDVRAGKHVVVVVVSEWPARARNWVVTAYLARKLAPGDSEWHRS